jgi:MFS family permease
MTPAGQSIDSSAVRVIAVSALCMGMGAFLGFIPGFLATALRDDLGISRGQVGLLVSLYFGCTGLGSIVAGRIADAFGARLVIAVDMIVVAAAAFFCAAVGTYLAWIVAAVLAGSGYGLVNVGTNVAIGRSVAPDRRTLAMSLKTAGVPTMATVSAAVGPGIANRTSWQAIVVTAGIIALVASLAALIVFADDRPGATAETVQEELPAGFWWFALGALLLIAGSQPLYSWTVGYLDQELNTSPGLAGAVLAMASGLGVVFMIWSAQRTDRVGPDARIRRLQALLAVNIGATLLVMAGEALGVVVAAIGVVIGISAQLGSIGTMHAAVVDRAPRAVGRATGVTMTGYYIGALVSPATFGWLADATDTFAWSWGATAALLTLALPVWTVAGRTVRVADRDTAVV